MSGPEIGCEHGVGKGAMVLGKDFSRGCHGESGENVRTMTGRTAFERLKLTAEDILLDVGTGTGEKALAAARICRKVIGIDIDRKNLERARKAADRAQLKNAVFAYGSFQEPSAEINLNAYDITKILAVYSLHHLVDTQKMESLAVLASLLQGPGRIVVGDLMFFDEPEKHRADFEKVLYDDGDTDFPSRAEYLTECLINMGARVQVEEIHPLAGVITADFREPGS
jgi:cyclopropane fatty-acyl-phospholipid synthase-like methyltransferase